MNFSQTYKSKKTKKGQYVCCFAHMLRHSISILL